MMCKTMFWTQSSLTDQRILQSNLEMVFEWLDHNIMKFNNDKVECIHFLKAKVANTSSVYKLSRDQSIKEFYCFKDLNIKFDHNDRFKGNPVL